MRSSRDKVPVLLQERTFIRACLHMTTPRSLEIYDRLPNYQIDFISSHSHQITEVDLNPYFLSRGCGCKYALSTETSTVALTPCRKLQQ
jgi:hypothetical protein